jgi:hypothetical protein
MKIGAIAGFDRNRHRNRYRDSAFELSISHSDCDTDSETVEFCFVQKKGGRAVALPPLLNLVSAAAVT